MPTHRIRLLGPWEYEFCDVTGTTRSSERSGTMTMPADWYSLFGDSAGTVTLRRKFHCPTNLEPHERVFVVMAGLDGKGTAWLNENSLGAFTSSGGGTEFDVTSHLKPFNTLAIHLSFSPVGGQEMKRGLIQPVALEIRSA